MVWDRRVFVSCRWLGSQRCYYERAASERLGLCASLSSRVSVVCQFDEHETTVSNSKIG